MEGCRLKEVENSILGSSYQFLKCLGSGGDGTVYLVRHIPTGQLRAAKGFRSESEGSRLRELQALRHLHHPSLPQVFDILEGEGECWLVMEYIDGRSLGCSDRTEVRAETFFQIGVQLAEVLRYLHTRTPPVLHLDIKPSNLLIDSTGRLVMIDFGAAIRQIPGYGENPCMGTPGFAAPEQMCRTASVDGRTDIYGCGAVLRWYLGGVRQGRRRWSFIRGSVCSWQRIAVHIIQRCLKAEKEQRFSDAGALLHALRKGRRRYRCWQKVKQASGACVLLSIAILFAAGTITRERRQETSSARQSYEQQLHIAEGLGLEQAVRCYENAARLCPDDYSWCLHLLGRITEDYCFEAEEETILKDLMYSVGPGTDRTNMEGLEADADLYGQFAYQTGLAYWYFYEQNGGKSAAVRWFCRAMESQCAGDTGMAVQTEADPGREIQDSQLPDWYTSAKLHAKIGSYYEKIGRKDENGMYQVEYAAYWEDLSALWQLSGFEAEPLAIRRQVAEELLAGIILDAHDLESGGVEQKNVKRMLASIRKFAKEEDAELYLQCVDAREAIDRAYGQKEM